jgi:hypothetical protein
MANEKRGLTGMVDSSQGSQLPGKSNVLQLTSYYDYWQITDLLLFYTASATASNGIPSTAKAVASPDQEVASV